MKSFKKIICPVDVYDFQPEAAAYATTLAKALDAKITVVYVMEPVPPRYIADGISFPSIAEEKEAKRKAEAKMQEILSNFFRSGVDKGEILLGHAADQIVRIAEEYSADMIIMASHGRSGLNRIIHGSVTNKVLASTKVPMLVVQPS